MSFVVGFILGAVAYHYFNNPDKAKELKKDIKDKIEQHKS